MSGYQGKNLRDEFLKWHEANPAVYRHVCRFADAAIAHGYRRFSIDCIWEKVRWEIVMSTEPTTEGEERFKLPHNHRAYYARMWLDDHPEHEGFFRTARLRSESPPAPRDRFGVDIEPQHAGV